MLGLQIIEINLLCGVNIAIVTYISIPGSNIEKPYYASVYHFVREVSAASIVNFIHKTSKHTKILPPYLLYNLLKTLIVSKH